MKNIFTKIYLHPLFLFTCLISILMGRFRFMMYFMLTIIIHELGHIIVSKIFHWKINKIIILPFGGLIKYEHNLNKLLIEEFLVAISGILFQMLFFLINKNYIRYNFFIYINYFIIIINLIPIYPLDGSKIINSILNIFICYKKCLKITCYISYVFIIGLLFLGIIYNKLLIIMTIFLFFETYKLNKNINYIYNDFLLERYIYNYKFKKSKIINNINNLSKDYKHIFNINNIYLTEKTYLKNIFGK